MTITFADGNITTDGTEQNIIDATANKHFALHLFTHNMASGDTVEIRIYTYDSEGTTQRLFDLITLIGAQSRPAYYIPFITDEKYKVTIKRTAGTDRVYNFKVVDVT